MLLALVGNQNCGKTTLFNQLTGSNQHVGNFPGVTIEHKIGQVIGWKNYDLVDLPGIYSIRPYSGEEKVTRDFIIDRKPDAIINIVDATNIERNLYLTLQLIEMGKPMVLALNMMDELLGNHGSVDIQKLSDRLGIPVVPIAAAKNDGVDELMRVVAETAEERNGEEEKRHAKDKVAHIAYAARVDEQQCHAKGRIDKALHVEREAESHHPCRKRGAYVCAHYHGYCLGEREQARIDKRHRHDRSGG